MPTLKRVLGLPALTFYGVGQILGAGIYSIIGAAAGKAGDAVWLSFLAAAAVAALTGLSYAELATAYPEAGAEYVYLRNAVPKAPWIAVAVGMTIVVAGTATAAAVALAFGGYLRYFVDLPVGLAAIGLLGACTLLGVAGIRESSAANVVFTLVEAGGLVLVIAAGIGSPSFGDALLVHPHPGVLSGAALVFFAYLGFEDLANLAEEARDPGRDLPKAILWSLGISTVLYLLVGLAVVALATPGQLAHSASPLASALMHVHPRLASVLGAVALFATANTALITLIVMSRMLLSMARSGALPRALARIIPGRQTPGLASVVTLALAVILVPIGDLEVVGGFSSLGLLLAFAAVNAALIILRYRQPALPRPFRVWGRIRGLPILPILGALAALGLATQFSPAVYALAGLMVAGTAGLDAGRRLLHRVRRTR
jgi:amino acid transporter